MDIDILKEQLKQTNIKYRKEGYGQVGYIEAQHAIREANRAFGYDGWSYFTKDLSNVQSEQKQKKKKNQNDHTVNLHYVGYTAKVTVKVGEISRDGCGFGQGINADLGKSHESAIKEAETDALKRALRSFGDIFGLALYSKDTSNIETLEDMDYKNAEVQGEKISSEKVGKLIVLCKKNGTTAQIVSGLNGVNHLAQLTDEQYETIIKNFRIKD